MALLVHLKTVSELRGKGDRIAKVTFRGRDPAWERPHLWVPGMGQGRMLGWESFSQGEVRRFFSGSGPSSLLAFGYLDYQGLAAGTSSPILPLLHVYTPPWGAEF